MNNTTAGPLVDGDRRMAHTWAFSVGAKLTLTITASQTIGRTYTYVVKRGELPTRTITCRAPGQSKGRSCG